MDTEKLEGRVALVTGSSAGVGRVIAFELAAAGAHVIINGRTSERVDKVVDALKAQGLSATGSPADLHDRHAIEAMVHKAAADHGRLDIVIANGAGATNVTLPWAFFHEMDPGRFQPIVDATWMNKAYLVRSALQFMIPAKYGKIVNISSDAALVPTPGESFIGGASAGLQQMMRVVARETGRYGIRINTISLGPLTDNPEDEIEGYRDMKSWIQGDETAHAKVANKLFARRMFPVAMRDVARTALFLAGAEGDNITGQTWSVNGGMSMPA